jgi:hypothetical protein
MSSRIVAKKYGLLMLVCTKRNRLVWHVGFRAVEHFTQAIMLRPEKAEYFYNRGNCYNKLGETQKALLDYSMAIRIDNKTATYYEHR